MKVLFLENVLHVAKKGEVKEVKPGYAQNMLFPKKLAVELTIGQEQKLKNQITKENNHKRELIENRYKIAEKLNNKKLNFKLKTTWWNKVFGWIWEKDIIIEVKRLFKLDITKKNIEMSNWHLKKLWEHQIFIKLGKDAMAKIFVIITAE